MQTLILLSGPYELCDRQSLLRRILIGYIPLKIFAGRISYPKLDVRFEAGPTSMSYLAPFLLTVQHCF